METIEIIIGILSFMFLLGGALIAWAWKMQEQISKLKTSVAVNTSKDEQIWVHVEKMELNIETIMKLIGEVKEELARRKK